MEISCAFPPRPDVADLVATAESLGYARAWLYDSPALYGDVWVHLALCAQRTERIGLGPAVLVPGFRHPLAQASAIATLAQLAPGRVAVAIGTGFTGRYALGQRAHTWAETTAYIDAVQRLLAGETVELDGGMCRIIASDGYLPARPIAVPVVVAANGPKGLAAARRLGAAGVMGVLGGQAGWSWSSVLAFGTVLDPGEDAGSDRALRAAGPAVAAAYHGIYEGAPDAVEGLPGGAAWRADLETVDPSLRHLALHEGHLTELSARDRAVVDGDAVRAFTWTGTADEVRARVDAFGASGGTEVLYAPMGDDPVRELRAFAAAVGLRPD